MSKKSLPPAPVASASVPAPMAALDMPQALRQYLSQQELTNLVDSADEARAWEALSRGLEMQVAGAIIAGYHAKRLRAQLGRGSFLSGLSERRIANQTAYDAIKTYELFASFEEVGSLRALGNLGLTKSRALADLSTGEIASLAEGEEVCGLTYERASEMSTRELQEHLKHWRQQHDEALVAERERNARLEADLASQRRKSHQLEQELKYRSGKDLPPWYRSTRIEAAATAETLDASLGELENLVAVPLFRPGAETEDEQLYLRRQVAGVVYHGLAAGAARITHLLRRIEETYGEAVTGPMASMAAFSLEGEELKLAAERRAEVLRRVEFERGLRQIAAQQPSSEIGASRRPGRPKGSKNKAK